MALQTATRGTLSFCISLLFAFSLWGCDSEFVDYNEGASEDPVDDPCTQEADALFLTNVEPAIAGSCSSVGGCHGGAGISGLALNEGATAASQTAFNDRFDRIVEHVIGESGHAGGDGARNSLDQTAVEEWRTKFQECQSS